ncbi:uncharacterized protein BYT42DRAFT_566278 [Radiomyces spectabilis]|uniref:uncharacterized protein n=1 Tax=Radiomyces spectabilis TaxID=64574 RepID=UPI00221EE9DE|nr:uncharacterized protein BYT42DRAFT_566278 [Radiomyces spectabilis]KAI8381363.1 hypothetical protein BYT42DRAFT_566278 [Radiomyces spectabilis]
MDTQTMNYGQPNTPAIPEKLPSISMLDEQSTSQSSFTHSPKGVNQEDDMQHRAYPSQQQQQQHHQQQQQQPPQQTQTNSFLPLPPPSYVFNPTTQQPMQTGLYKQSISPPLTPAVSPSSVLLDSMQFKRKFSVDVGPFSFGSGIPHPPAMHDQDAYRRSSCSAAMSVDDCLHESSSYSTATAAMTTRCQDYSFLTAEDPTMATFTTPQPFKSPMPKRTSRQFNGSSSQAPNAQHKHVCKYAHCGWSFKRYEHLKRHMLVHTGERPHVCHFPGCGKSFSRSDNFHAHYRTHTKKTIMQQNRRMSQQNAHLQTTSSPTTSSSQAAAAVAAAAAAAAAVARTSQGFDDRMPTYFAHTKDESFDMPYPDMYDHRQAYMTEGQEDYACHHPHDPYMRSFHPSGQFTMQASPLSPSSPSGHSLLNHESASQSPNPFFSSTPMDHTRSTHSPFYSMNSMPVLPPHPNTQPSSHRQPTQGSPTTTSSAMVSASMPGPYVTDQFAVPSNPRRSSSASSTSSSNSQQKSHVCPVPACQRRFKRLEHLKRHMRIHTLERPFACSFPNCHKTFSRSDNLSQHMKTHQRVEDRRRRQQQQNEYSPNQNGNSMNAAAAAAAAAAASMGMNWHTANAGTVGC